MFKRRILFAATAFLVFLVSGLLLSRAQQAPPSWPPDEEMRVEHAECTFFGDTRPQFLKKLPLGPLGPQSAGKHLTYSLSSITEEVSQSRGFIPGGSRTHGFELDHAPGSIDSYIFADLQANGIKPAAKTNDFEFIRRATLDLTGRIPNPDRVAGFAADTTPDKRARLVDELLAKPEWADKWTMFFGDLYKNTDNRPSTSLRRFPQGRNAFYQWIHDSIAANKPYNQMAADLIAATGTSSFDKGEINWLIGGVVTGGPVQDITDQQAAN